MTKTTRINFVSSLYIQKGTMKILLIIVALMTVVYGFTPNPERSERFRRDYIQCNKEYGHEKLTFCLESFQCALSKGSHVLYQTSKEYDEFTANQFLEFMKDIFLDEWELQQAQRLLKGSYKQIPHNSNDE